MRSQIQSFLGPLSKRIAPLALAALPALTGCSIWDRVGPGPNDTTTSYYREAELTIEYPEVQECATPVSNAAKATVVPNALADPSSLPSLDLTLDEAIRMALENSPVIRSLNASVAAAPQSATTRFTPAQAATGISGTERALAAFDANFTQSLFWNKNDAPLNVPPGFGAFVAAQSTTAAYSNQLSKSTATGATFSLRHVVNYDRPDQIRTIASDFTGWVEAEWRQPLMQGAGLKFNRIVGVSPFGGPQVGQYNGVLIGRITEDISLADFERAFVGLVADVEEAYWNLSVSYRLLEANLKGRESALRTFQYQNARVEIGAGRPDEEAQARSQYYQFEANVQEQLAGQIGLYAREQQLRYLLGMPATDGSLIRPVTDPSSTRVVFDWDSALSQALERRVEIRRQSFQVKQRELELYAARLNKRPQLDFVGSYRFRGLGDHLIGDTDKDQFDNLYDSLNTGDFQEWRAGFEFSLPVGLRAASIAIANAKLNLRRDQAVLAETQLRISHDLTNAARNLDLTHKLVDTNYNRYQSDLQQVEVLERRYRDGTDNINFLLQAQRQVVTSEVAFYQALANYNLAIRDLHREKGSLLAYNQVQLAESAWDAGATRDAYEKGLFLTPRNNPSRIDVPSPITRRAFHPSAPQDTSASTLPGGIQPDVLVEPLPPTSFEMEAPASDEDTTMDELKLSTDE
ncbi:MAG: TolC family protein [Planctomycetota bacterium]